MHQTWKLQDAKNRFSEVIDNALHSGPQTVSRRGKDTVVILSISDYQRLIKRKSTLIEFFMKSPLRGVSLDLKRGTDPSRDVNL